MANAIADGLLQTPASKHVLKYLDAADKVRPLLGNFKDISVPTIAVIGTQSAGKSSVLQRFSGIRLPNGAGLKTKCPLVLQMRRDEKSECRIGLRPDDLSVCAELEISTRIDELSEQIMEEEDEDLRDAFQLSKRPIYLNVQGPSLWPLTLVDLPGVYRTSAEGTTIPGLEDYIHELYMEYISKPNCVILCVLPASEDATTQIAQGWATEADPDRSRSVFVFTKVDLALGMGGGKKADLLSKLLSRSRTLEGLDAPLWFALANQIVDEEPTLKEEKEFLHRQFPEAANASCLGLEALTTLLSGRLADITLTNLPELLKSVQERAEHYEVQLEDLPEVVTEETAAKVYTTIVMDVNMHLKSVREGIYTPMCDSDSENFMHNLNNCAEQFQKQLQVTGAQILTPAFGDQMRLEFARSAGAYLEDVLFPRMLVKLVRDEVNKRMRRPAEFFLQSCHDALEAAIVAVISAKCKGRRQLLQHMVNDAREVLEEMKKKCAERLSELIAQEASDVYTRNHYYEQNMSKWRGKVPALKAFLSAQPEASRIDDDKVMKLWDEYQIQKQIEEARMQGVHQSATAKLYVAPPEVHPPMSNEEAACFNVQLMFMSYRQVVRKRFLDSVILMVRYYYTTPFFASLMDTCMKRSWDSAHRGTSVYEMLNDPDVVRRTDEIKANLHKLQNALFILRGV